MPIPHPPIPTIEPLHENKGGAEDFGYERVKGSDPPKWMLYWGDEVFFFSPTDPAYASLLDAYRDAVDKYSSDMTTIMNERIAQDLIFSGMKWEGLILMGSGITAGVNCPAAIPTFWAGGGTTWICVGGAASFFGSIGAGVNSIKQLFESFRIENQTWSSATTAQEEAETIYYEIMNYCQETEDTQP